jgi:hypothetical protein
MVGGVSESVDCVEEGVHGSEAKFLIPAWGIKSTLA